MKKTLKQLLRIFYAGIGSFAASQSYYSYNDYVNWAKIFQWAWNHYLHRRFIKDKLGFPQSCHRAN